MIYTFRILSAEDENYFREIEIDNSLTFLDLHYSIAKCNNFDPSQMASFFICDQNWEKQKEITLFDMEEDDDDKSMERHPMDVSVLSEFVSEKQQKLLYIFDFFTERGFFIELMNIKKKVKGQNFYSKCTLSHSDPPVQFLDPEQLDDFLDTDDLDKDWEDSVDEDEFKGFTNIDDLEDI